jgi:RNA polymerase sigma-70 factor (ECF subfamily)
MSSEFADPDIELMLRLQKGDEHAFEELVRKHTRRILNLVYRYLGDAMRAEDVSQDIFVTVYRVRMTYEPKATFYSWLHRIAVNHCLNEIRLRKIRTTLAAPLDDLLQDQQGGKPDASLSLRELRQAVKAAIDGLPGNQRMAVILARYEEMSYDQIAKTMGLSIEAVKSVLFRARENLKQALAPYAR